MSAPIAKANKNFLVYCLVGVLKMLQGHAKCRHIDGLGAVMNSCDASILDEVLDNIAKLSACIMKRWWSSYGLSYVTEAFRVEPEVRLFFFFVMLRYLWAGCLFYLGPVMQGEGDGGGTSRAANAGTGPLSRANDNRQLPQGDVEADWGAARDQGYGAASDPEGHLEPVEGHGAEV
jgi:hypothetical protein